VTEDAPQRWAIRVDSAGAVIEDTTIRGRDASAHAIQHAVYNTEPSTVGRRLNMTACAECWWGPGTLRDSFADVSAVIDGAHYEDIYYGGGDGPLTVEHDTLLNPQQQTATVFVWHDFGLASHIVVDGNLLAGGGFTVYGGDSSATDVRVTNNRFARCITASVFNQSSGGFDCRGGPDSHGYYPDGGYFGHEAYFNRSQTTWSGNIWDNTLGPVKAPGK
jgi:hypothetical protein